MPDMIHAYARHLARELSAPGRPVEIRALAKVSLNGRAPAPIVDSEVDLGAVELSVWPARWILPFPGEGADAAVTKR